MIKPSELLQAAQNYKHFIFYGMDFLPQETYILKLSKGYGEMDLSQIKWNEMGLEGTSMFNYSKAIRSLCCGNVSANFIAKVLDKYAKVKFFSEENETLYIYCEVK
jgi:hypothetical protein